MGFYFFLARKLLTQGHLQRVALYITVTLLQTFHFFLFSIFSRQSMYTTHAYFVNALV